MERGKNICERANCSKEAKADYQRRGPDLVGWHEKMPIALCAVHCRRNVPVICDLQINRDGELVYNVMAYPGYTLRKTKTKAAHVIRRFKRRKGTLSEIARKCGINYKLLWQRIKRGRTLKQAKKKIVVKKPVIMLTKELEVVREFDSIADAGRATGIDSKLISRVLTGTRRKSTGGYVFKYKNKAA